MFNKCDKITENIPEDEHSVKISALENKGISRLLRVIADTLPPTSRRMRLLLPYDKAGILAKIRENGKVFSENYTENGIETDALVDISLIKQAEQYAASS